MASHVELTWTHSVFVVGLAMPHKLELLASHIWQELGRVIGICPNHKQHKIVQAVL